MNILQCVEEHHDEGIRNAALIALRRLDQRSNFPVRDVLRHLSEAEDKDLLETVQHAQRILDKEEWEKTQRQKMRVDFLGETVYVAEDCGDEFDEKPRLNRFAWARRLGASPLSNSRGEEHGDNDEDDDEDEEIVSARAAVRALRRVAEERSLGEKARRKLFSEVIYSPGESVPERAYKVFLGGKPAQKGQALGKAGAAWEDFASFIEAHAKGRCQ